MPRRRRHHQEVIHDKGYTFLLVSPHLEFADDSNFGNIDEIYEYANDHGYRFLCLTASTEKAIKHWRDITGAEYPFYVTDETTLKTIIRSNPRSSSAEGRNHHPEMEPQRFA